MEKIKNQIAVGMGVCMLVLTLVSVFSPVNAGPKPETFITRISLEQVVPVRSKSFQSFAKEPSWMVVDNPFGRNSKNVYLENLFNLGSDYFNVLCKGAQTLWEVRPDQPTDGTFDPRYKFFLASSHPKWLAFLERTHLGQLPIYYLDNGEEVPRGCHQFKAHEILVDKISGLDNWNTQIELRLASAVYLDIYEVPGPAIKLKVWKYSNAKPEILLEIKGK